MITSEELLETIGNATCSREAYEAFSRRLARHFHAALTAAGVEYHAINGEAWAFAVGRDGFDKVIKLALRSNFDGTWMYSLTEALAHDRTDTQEQIADLTTLGDDFVIPMAKDWAAKIAEHSKLIVFTNMYIPKAVQFADGYNDLKIAFRIIRAWDPVCSGFILRIDSVYKSLAV